MQRFSGCLVTVAVFILIAIPVQAGQPDLFSAPKAGIVDAERIDLRNGPDSGEAVFCRISQRGAPVKILGVQADWYYIQAAGCVGWVEMSQVLLDEDAAPAPVDAAEVAATPDPVEVVEALKETVIGGVAETTLPAEDAEGNVVRQPVAQTGVLIYNLPGYGRTGKSKLDLRSGPTPDEAVVCRVPQSGTAVGVRMQQGDWFEIKVAGCTGWVLGQNLDLSGIDFERQVMATVVRPASETSETLPSLEQEAASQEMAEDAPAQAAENEPVEEIVASNEPVAAEIKRIAFSGNTKIDSAILKQKTEQFIGQELTFDDMKVVAETVTIVYQESGYILARAFIPPQAIQDGVLHIAVSEGNLGKIEVTGNRYYNDRVLKRYFKPLLKEGVVRESLLEEAILLTKEIDSADASVVLKKGEVPGTVDMQVDTKDSFAVHWGADWNNTGTKLVSRQRFSSYFDITEPFWGSSLGIKGSTGSYWGDSGLIDVNYTLPLFSWGTKLSLSYLEADYVVGGDLTALGMEGYTKVYSADLRHPLWVKRHSRLDLELGYERKLTKNYILGSALSLDELDSYKITLIYDSLDRFLGKNVINIGYSYSNMIDSRNKDKGLPTARVTNSYFDRFSFLGARIQKLPGPFMFVARAMAQASDDRLAPIEEMIIGGYSTVRGQKSGVYIGDYGYAVSGELMMSPPFIGNMELFGQRISQMFQFAAFYDYGSVHTRNPTAFEIGHEDAGGFGVGFRVYYKDLLRFKFDVAWPQHQEPGSEPYYIYMQAAVNFF